MADKCASKASGVWGSGNQDSCEVKSPQSSGLLQKRAQQSAAESVIDDRMEIHDELEGLPVGACRMLDAKQLESILHVTYELTAKQASLGTPVDPVLLE